MQYFKIYLCSSRLELVAFSDMTLNKPAACTAKFTMEPAGIVWWCVHAENCTQSFFQRLVSCLCPNAAHTLDNALLPLPRGNTCHLKTWMNFWPDPSLPCIGRWHRQHTEKNDKPRRKDQSRNSRTRLSRLRTTPLKAYLDEPSTVKAAKPSRKLHNIFYGQKRTDKSNVRLADWLARPPLSFSKTRRPTPVELSRSSGKDSWTNAELLFQLS